MTLQTSKYLYIYDVPIEKNGSGLNLGSNIFKGESYEVIGEIYYSGSDGADNSE